MRRCDRRLPVVAVAFAVLAIPSRPSHASARLDAQSRRCLERLPALSPDDQLACLGRLRRAGPAAVAATPTLAGMLQRSNGATDHRLIVAILDVLRSLGRRAAPAVETLSELLQHRARLHESRDKAVVIRLRAYLMLTLADLGYPPSAMPLLVDSLAHVDERMAAVEVGAAARAVRSLGPAGCAWAPYLLDKLTEQFGEEEFSLERYQPRFPPEEATTIQLETIRTLGRVCSAQDRVPVAALRRLAEERGGGLDPRVKREARVALGLMHRGAPPQVVRP